MQVFYDLGIAKLLYWSCYAVGFITIFVFNAFYGRRYGIQPGKALAFTVVSYALIYAWAYILAWVVNGFEWGHHNAIRVYIWFPLVLLLTGRIFKIKWDAACEFITPSTCLVYGIARLGCNFTGCCYGIPVSWGIESVQAGHRVFPVQTCEALTSLAIAFMILHLAKKRDYKPDGTLYPLMMILYGGTRFLWEFLADNQKLFLHLSELALWALFTCLLGLAWLFTTHERIRRSAARSAQNQKRRKRT